jgi:hypothetical protein
VWEKRVRNHLSLIPLFWDSRILEHQEKLSLKKMEKRFLYQQCTKASSSLELNFQSFPPVDFSIFIPSPFLQALLLPVTRNAIFYL